MSGKDMFPDYQPKKSPDTIFDYGVPKGSKLEKVLKKLGVKSTDLFPVLELEKLDLALKYFKKYKPLAEANPGKMEEGHPLLDGPGGKYVPSEEELIVSEIGKMIQILMFNADRKKFEEYKVAHKIGDLEIIYQQIDFSHSDVMGSGRFFHAEKTERIRLSF